LVIEEQRRRPSPTLENFIRVTGLTESYGLARYRASGDE
jgi:hypothetical protein